MPRLVVDYEAGTAYLYVSDKPVVRSVDLGEGVIVDYDEQGEVVGIEFLDLVWLDAL